MKHIKTFSQLKESVNEAVSVDTIRYKRSHGKEPRGTGQWAFYFDRTGGDPIFTPTAMSYVDAVKWAKEEAKKSGKSVVYVGESVESLTEMNMMLPNVSDVDHTRIVKWMGNAYDYPKQYDIKRKGKDLEITIKQMNSREIEDLKAYLKSQDYINEALKIGDFVRYKKDKDFSGGKILYFMGGKATVKAWDGSELEFDPKDLEYVKSWNEALVGPFMFTDKMSDEELKKMYDEAVGGYANWQKGFQYPKSDYKKAYQEIEKILKKRGVKVDESLNEREYSDEERKDMADKGLALPDGSFPIKDLEDLKNAIQAYGRSKNQAATAKFIVKRAKALSAEDLIPDTEDFQKSLKETMFEGNAFLAARAKAIEEDAEEFEFNGKKYPVLNRSKKLNEMLSDKDAYKIIDAGSKFSAEVGGHILATQTFDSGNELVDYLLSDFIDQKDHAKFLKSVKKLIEGTINEASKINVKDIKVGSILNFNDGEQWKVTKFIGNPSNPRGVFALPHGDTKKNYVSVALEFTIDDLEQKVNSLNEATTSWAKLMKGVKSSETGPWSLVAIDNKKVVGQKIDIRTPDIIPAHYEAMRKEHPKAKIHVEDGTGSVVWTSDK